MCTLAVAFQVDRRFPLVVAANRDERLGRPAETWALRDGPLPYAAPRDLQAGGTWIGVSASGLFAAVTNFHTGQSPDPARRSRGELVPLALSAPDAAGARRLLAGRDAAGWNPFHLLVAGPGEAFLWWFDGESRSLDPLAPGLHIVTERSPDGRDPRGEAVRARWPVDLAPASLSALLATHDAVDAGRAICVHGDPVYGTRSSALLRLGASLATSELYVADGPPCRAPHDDRSQLLARLAARLT
jgi:uncharacterized protein with NRDE domain